MLVARASQDATSGAPARAGPDFAGELGERALTAIEFPRQAIAGAGSHEG